MKGLNSKSSYSSYSLSNGANDLKRDWIIENKTWMREQTAPDKHNAKWIVRTQKKYTFIILQPLLWFSQLPSGADDDAIGLVGSQLYDTLYLMPHFNFQGLIWSLVPEEQPHSVKTKVSMCSSSSCVAGTDGVQFSSQNRKVTIACVTCIVFNELFCF